jgi:hypothetical protein
MKRSMYGVMFAALLTLSLSVVARATTTDELIISSGGTCTVVDNATLSGSCGTLGVDSNATAGTDTTSGSLNGWTITVVTGISNSPSVTPYGLDLVSLTADCTLTTCATLDIKYTDINFDIPVSTFVSPLTANNNGGGSTTESAYVSSTNTLGAETTLIGTQTFSATGSASTTVSGGSGAGSYSLTLDESFTGVNGATYNDTGQILSAPEGWSLSSTLGMLGFGVVALVVARRRGLVKTTV